MTDVTDTSGTMDSGAGKDAQNTRPRPALKHSPIVAQLNRAYLRAVIMAWEEQNLPLIDYLGIPLALARRLATAPGIVIDRLGHFRSPVALFQGDALQIERLLDHKMNELERQAKVDEMLQLGATVHHIMRLTGMSDLDVSTRIQALGISGQRAHRPTGLNAEEMQAAEQAWLEFRHLPPMDHWISMARKTGISIRRLHASYRKFELPLPGEEHDRLADDNNNDDHQPFGATA